MPKSRRDLLKRKVGYVLGNLDRAMEFALDVRDQFIRTAGVDPESETLSDDLRELAKSSQHALIAYFLEAGLRSMLSAQEMVKHAATEAWGGVPENIEQWRNQGKDIHRQTREV